MKKIGIILIICILFIPAFAQVQVYPLKEFPEKGVKYVGKVQYALPTTTLKVTVSVSKVQDIRGYFADYAESLLGLTNIIQQNRTYSISLTLKKSTNKSSFMYIRNHLSKDHDKSTVSHSV